MWNYGGYDHMMGFGAGFFGFITWLVFMTVGVLLAIFLWQKINKK
jgi:hypothetical protein